MRSYGSGQRIIIGLHFEFKLFFVDSLVVLWLFQGVLEQRLRAHLGSFGITGNLALQSMYTLSGLFLIRCPKEFILSLEWFRGLIRILLSVGIILSYHICQVIEGLLVFS